MSTENRFNPETTGTGEAFDWETRLAELEKQGIVSGGGGSLLESLKKMPQLPPGALERFLEREYQGFPKRDAQDSEQDDERDGEQE